MKFILYVTLKQYNRQIQKDVETSFEKVRQYLAPFLSAIKNLGISVESIVQDIDSTAITIECDDFLDARDVARVLEPHFRVLDINNPSLH